MAMINDLFQKLPHFVVIRTSTTVDWPGCFSPGQLCFVHSAQEGVDVPLTMLGVKNNGVSTDWVIFWGKNKMATQMMQKVILDSK